MQTRNTLIHTYTHRDRKLLIVDDIQCSCSCSWAQYINRVCKSVSSTHSRTPLSSNQRIQTKEKEIQWVCSFFSLVFSSLLNVFHESVYIEQLNFQLILVCESHAKKFIEHGIESKEMEQNGVLIFTSVLACQANLLSLTCLLVPIECCWRWELCLWMSVDSIKSEEQRKKNRKKSNNTLCTVTIKS